MFMAALCQRWEAAARAAAAFGVRVVRLRIGFDGTLVSGIDALLEVWRTLPRWRVLAAAAARPGLHRIGDLLYEGIVVPTIGAWGARRAHPRMVAKQDGQHA
jgi:hypothetical protein